MEKKSSRREEFEVGAGDERLDIVLAYHFTELSRSKLQAYIRAGRVCCGNEVCLSPGRKPAAGMTVSVDFPEEKELLPKPEEIPLQILYEDGDIIVIDKEPGMVVHPGKSHSTGTIVNALLFRYPGLVELRRNRTRPGIVHRLDKDSSGCLLVALNSRSERKLLRQFSRREIHKTYSAICLGAPPDPVGKISTFIGRHPVKRKKMSVLEDGKEAVSRYRLVEKGFLGGTPVSLVEIEILTGRTHQIRVHMAHIGCPVLGDSIYGKRHDIKVGRQMLHACRIQFSHPSDGKSMDISSPLPEDFRKILAISSG